MNKYKNKYLNKYIYIYIYIIQIRCVYPYVVCAGPSVYSMFMYVYMKMCLYPWPPLYMWWGWRGVYIHMVFGRVEQKSTNVAAKNIIITVFFLVVGPG